MLNVDQNNAAVFAGTTGNGADLAVVVGRDHRCLPLRARKPSGKRLLTAYCTTPAVSSPREAVGMPMSSVPSPSWHGQQPTAPDHRETAIAVAPAIWAALRIQQAL